MIPLSRLTAKHIIFDLDGTLVDSAPAIIDSFEKAFIACGRALTFPLDDILIGPPLMETLATLAGTTNEEILIPLADAFKAHYDQVGYRQTKAFPWIPEILEKLYHRGCTLYLATNKRIIPTRKILEYFGWLNYFTGIYTLDSFVPALKTKHELLGRIIKEGVLDCGETIYIGDRNEDGEAASHNGIGFLMVGWGYDC